MTIEKSHGRGRTTMPRASDARPCPDTGPVRTVRRGGDGRFLPGNTEANGGKFKATMRKGLGSAAGAPEGATTAREARFIFDQLKRELGSDSPLVLSPLMTHARATANAAYFTRLADEAGLSTPEGLKYLALADNQSTRALRALVAAQSMAHVVAQQNARRRADADADPLADYMDDDGPIASVPPRDKCNA